MFQGRFSATRTCGSCGRAQECSEPFKTIYLPLQNDANEPLGSLSLALGYWVSGHHTGYTCTGCNRDEHSTKRTISTPPTNLVLCLMRFNGSCKLSHPVDIERAAMTLEHKHYGLYAGVVHIGESVRNGHYIAYVKIGDGCVSLSSSTPCLSNLQHVAIRWREYLPLFFAPESQIVRPHAGIGGSWMTSTASPRNQQSACRRMMCSHG